MNKLSFVTIVLICLIAPTFPQWGIQFIKTWRVSVSSNGTQSNGNSHFPVISSYAGYVAFESDASNLVPNDNNNLRDIFVNTFSSKQTNRVSVSTGGLEGNGDSFDSAISADGRYVLFSSAASNLVPGDTNGRWDVFLRDQILKITVRISIRNDGVQSNGNSFLPSISANGRYIAYVSDATNLIFGGTNGYRHVYVFDMFTGETSLVSKNSLGELGNLGVSPYKAPISLYGRYIAFASNSSNLVENDNNGFSDIFVHDLLTGQTTLVSKNANGQQGNGWSAMPSISEDGRFVAFESKANNLVENDTNGFVDVFVRDRLLNTTKRVSVSSNGQQGNHNSFSSSISADGKIVAFTSGASTLIDGDGSIFNYHVFIHNLDYGITRRASISTEGEKGSGDSLYPSTNRDGQLVVFHSSANNLVMGDTNGKNDVFVHLAAVISVQPIFK